jgi:predicted transcriptional regulator
MTLTWTPDTEARVRSVAEMSGQDPEDALIALLNQALAEAEAESEMLAELRASVEDHDAGRSMTIEEYRVKALARRQARDAKNAPQVEITA